MRSLTFKLIAAFLVTSVLGVGLAAVLARGVTTREFSRFVMGQLRNEFVANAVAYYRAHGSWAGASEYFRQMDDPPPEPGAPRSRARRRGRSSSCWRIRMASRSPQWSLITSANASWPPSWQAAYPSKWPGAGSAQ